MAAADDWLAMGLADPGLVKQVLLAESADEYWKLIRLMSVVGCMWIQIGSSKWGDKPRLVTHSASGSTLRLTYSRKGSVMSEVEEHLASGGLALANGRLVAKRHCIEDLVMLRWRWKSLLDGSYLQD